MEVYPQRRHHKGLPLTTSHKRGHFLIPRRLPREAAWASPALVENVGGMAIKRRAGGSRRKLLHRSRPSHRRGRPRRGVGHLSEERCLMTDNPRKGRRRLSALSRVTVVRGMVATGKVKQNVQAQKRGAAQRKEAANGHRCDDITTSQKQGGSQEGTHLWQRRRGTENLRHRVGGIKRGDGGDASCQTSTAKRDAGRKLWGNDIWPKLWSRGDSGRGATRGCLRGASGGSKSCCRCSSRGGALTSVLRRHGGKALQSPREQRWLVLCRSSESCDTSPPSRD
jgi:hypothetical protein